MLGQCPENGVPCIMVAKLRYICNPPQEAHTCCLGSAHRDVVTNPTVNHLLILMLGFTVLCLFSSERLRSSSKQ